MMQVHRTDNRLPSPGGLGEGARGDRCLLDHQDPHHRDGRDRLDFLFIHLSHVLTLVIGITGFTVSLVLQLRARRYVPWVYWLAVVMVMFGPCNWSRR